MKNLGKTIDQLIKIDPELSPTLTSIKNRWRRTPQKVDKFWDTLLDFLNTEDLIKHPKRMQMKKILNPPQKNRSKTLNTFETISPIDEVIGVVPENIADRIRRYDRRTIENAKRSVETSMTKSSELLAKVERDKAANMVEYEKTWIQLKDHFKLWSSPHDFTFKVDGPLLLITKVRSMPPMIIGPGIVRMDLETTKRFYKFLGVELPEGLASEEGGN